MIVERAQVADALPQYELGTLIGSGAHGLVFTARHRRLGTTCAIKVLVATDSERAVSARRFKTEAEVMTTLDHPHVVRVQEYAEGRTIWLLVMEYLSAGSLIGRMRKPIAPAAACAVALAVADALAAAHARGVVHRDIKPANLLFTADGLVKISDFGIAKLFTGPDASASVELVGTPRYISPEQITGGRVSPATDLYALGVCFYELLDLGPDWIAHSEVPLRVDHAVFDVRRTGEPEGRPQFRRRTLLAGAGGGLVGLTLAVAGLTAAVRPGRTSPMETPSVDRGRPAVAPIGSTPAVPVFGPVLSPDGGSVAWIDNARISVWTPVGGREAKPRTFGDDEQGFSSAAFDPRGWLLATGGNETVVIWDATTGHQYPRPLAGGPHNTSVVAFGRNGLVVAASGVDTTVVRMWDLPTSELAEAPFVSGRGQISALAFNPRADQLAAASDGVRLWPLGASRGGREAIHLPVPGVVGQLRFSPDGSLLAAVTDEGQIFLFDVSLTPIQTAPVRRIEASQGSGASMSVGFGKDSATMITFDGRVLQWWDRMTGAEAGPPADLHLADEVRTSVFSQDGTRLAAAISDGQVKAWELT
ncbi:WD40 repeat domain-containing serine/threonine protein kinase [Cryptosporangium aurantiacum]|uniref:non-specific serine/threonine protein kinase n=1 Tax=Cryptosporangium aurantiacum TaxID=134849 RepID=A0A1M7L1M4_9ACTN|nr:WD40 repeat domain-containing serine/threonine protein kinase [Cryptosporangium aurantiacum]SHM71707.1 Protein kinase domain-containing protein [Cryptosporangium aurantiacum]